MNIKKSIGYCLLLLGIVAIVWSLFSSYSIFIRGESPPNIFELEEDYLGSDSGQTEIEDLIRYQVGELIPVEEIFRLLNLTAWSMFAFILIFGGSKISSLGIKLIKK